MWRTLPVGHIPFKGRRGGMSMTLDDSWGGSDGCAACTVGDSKVGDAGFSW